MKLDKGSFDVDGLFVEYARPAERRTPAGTPLLFIHGGNHGSWCWRHYLDYFAENQYECFALNWYNHYRSKEISLDRFLARGIVDIAEDIGRVIVYLEHAPILLGHSLGGLASQKYAEKNDCLGLILIASAAPAKVVKGDIELPMLLPEDEPVLVPLPMAKEIFFQGLSDQDVEKFFELMSPESPAVILDGTGRIAIDRTKICVPMLVISGELDPLAPAGLARDLAAYYNADHYQLAGKGHNLLLEPGWRETAVLIRDWLQEKFSD